MHPTPTTITAAAQSPSATPAVRARLRNRHLSGAHRLIWSQAYAGAEAAGHVATVLTAAGTSVTARTDGTAIYLRRVAPVAGAAWGTWTALVAGAVSGTPVALATFGPTVALYYNGSGNTVNYRVSRDDGVTWDAAVAGITLGAAIAKLAVAVRPDASGTQFGGGERSWKEPSPATWQKPRRCAQLAGIPLLL